MPTEPGATLSLDRYAPDAKAWVVASQTLADERGHGEIAPLHLLASGLERSPGIVEVLRRARVDVAELAGGVERALGTFPRTAGPAYLSSRLLDLLRRAERNADAERAGAVEVAHVLGALTQEVRGPAAELLGAQGVGPASLAPHLAPLRGDATSRGEPAPASFGRDLLEAARAADSEPVVGRADAVRRLVTILERRHKSHVLLVGEPGIGKGALVRAVAREVVAGRVPPRLASARMVEVDVGALAGLSRLRGDAEARLRKVVEGARDRETILVIRAFEQLFGQGSGGDLLRPLLARRDVHLLVTTTPEGLARMEDRDAGFVAELSTVRLEEPSVSETTEILRGLRPGLEAHHGVTVAEEAVPAAAAFAKRYVQDRHLPDSAIDLLDESCATVRIAAPAGAAPRVVEGDVAATVATWTGIPVAKMLESDAEKLRKMEARLAERVVGQDEAVRAVSRAVRRGRVGLRDPKRPIGSFLFLGPSGVGKTELAKAVASFLFDDEASLTRLDMSEFMERHMAQRLLGAPPGYADAEQGGVLTEAVRRRPYSVLLFDEVEKAHADVFHLLLQVLDDGRLTDGRGRLADFTSTVLILTSNLGSDAILDAGAAAFETDAGRDALRETLLGRLREFFRPELLNRIDDVVVFRPLGKPELRAIVDLQLGHVEALLAPRRVRLDVDDAAKDRLVDLGYEPALGARPLRRAVLRHVQDALADRLLGGGIPDGATIRVRRDGDGFRLE